LPRVVGDRIDLVEELSQTLLLEPLEGVQLRLNQVSDLELVGDLSIIDTAGTGSGAQNHMLEFPERRRSRLDVARRAQSRIILRSPTSPLGRPRGRLTGRSGPWSCWRDNDDNRRTAIPNMATRPR